MKKLFSTITMLVLISALIGTSVQASTTTLKIKKLISKMESYEFAVLAGEEIKTDRQIKLTPSSMAKASALSVKVSDKNGIEKGEFGGYTTFKLTDNQISDASINLFGVKITQNSLSKKRRTEWSISDAFLYKDGTPVVYHADGETELDFTKTGMNINKTKNGSYNVIQTAYYGYWGFNDGKPNYKISYNVKKNKKSSYGYVITQMRITPIVK